MTKLKPTTPRKLLIAIFVGVFAIYFIYVHAAYFSIQYKVANSTLPYLSPRIFAENQNDILINFISLRDQLRQFVASKNNTLGVYFEYLPSGTSIGVNDREEHRFASLLKVPVVMAYYLQAEKEGLSINQTFEIKDDELDKGYGDLWRKGYGTKITANELIKEILINSDNTALKVLADHTKRGYVEFIFNNLDVTLDRDENNIQTISPKKYSSIFRSLYLSSLLPKEQSNKILEVMTQSSAHDTLTEGVPPQIKVANKIGELSDELYWDCGIIYEPKRPYLVCAFSTQTTSEAKNDISTISKIIYDYIHNVNTAEK